MSQDQASRQAFRWRDGTLWAEEVPLPTLAAAAGTPTYVYSRAAITAAYHRLAEAFSPLSPTLHYAVKASPNHHLCGLLGALGAGLDVVSGGELERAWLAGVPMAKVVFAGVGKSDTEIRAALDGRHSLLGAAAADLAGREPSERGPVGLFNVESASELERIAAVAGELGARPMACLRVNPDVDPHTHEYTTTGKKENKFGIEADQVVGLFDTWSGHPAIELCGLHVHIGSPVPQVEPYGEAVAVLLALIDKLEKRGHPISVLNLGGGWPVSYREGETPPIEDYAECVVPLLAERVERGLEVHLEPGRAILAEAGLLVTRVLHTKQGRSKSFVICDAGMQTLIRPALYRAFHFVWPVDWKGDPPPRVERPEIPGLRNCDVVGPICETGDFLARDRPLPELARGDLVAVFTAGAYGMSMASNYNDHGRPAEVLVSGDRARLINERQPLAAILAGERRTRELELEIPVAAP